MRLIVCTVDIDPCPLANTSSMAIAEAIDFAAFDITPLTIAAVYSWGLGSVIVLWGLGYSIGLSVGLIRKV